MLRSCKAWFVRVKLKKEKCWICAVCLHDSRGEAGFGNDYDSEGCEYQQSEKLLKDSLRRYN